MLIKWRDIDSPGSGNSVLSKYCIFQIRYRASGVTRGRDDPQRGLQAVRGQPGGRQRGDTQPETGNRDGTGIPVSVSPQVIDGLFWEDLVLH